MKTMTSDPLAPSRSAQFSACAFGTTGVASFFRRYLAAQFPEAIFGVIAE